MKITVEVSSEILDWVFSNIQLEKLSNKIIDYLKAWQNGEKKPTFNQVEEVSKATGIPLGYFFLSSPPIEDLSFINYRTVKSLSLDKPSRDLIDTMHDMEQIQDWLREYLLSEGIEKLNFVGKLKNETNIEFFASKIRKILNIEIEWYKNVARSEEAFNLIRAAISDAGVTVMTSGIVGNNTHRHLDTNEFRAFAMVDEYAPLIFINFNDSINGKVFSLIHEFAHICIGESSLYNDRDSTATGIKKVEIICNSVAAEILAPDSIFFDSWSKIFSEEQDNERTLRRVAKKFKCGTTVIARKAYDHNLIDYTMYCFIARMAVQHYNETQEKNKKNGGNFYNTLASRIDKRFLRMLTNSVRLGGTLYSDAFRLTNTNRSTFEKLIKNVGGGMYE